MDRRGGRGIPVQADLSDEDQVVSLFQQIERLDVLAIPAWGADFMTAWGKPFWELSPELWRDTLATLNVFWRTCVHAGRLMKRQRSGLILMVTDNLHDNTSGYRGQILHDLGHECINRTTEAIKKQFRFDLSESPEYIGRAVAALAADPGVSRHNGKLLWVADLAREYGFTDIDGRYIPRFDPASP